MRTDTATDSMGSLTVSEPAPGVLEVVVQGRLSPEVGATFPGYAKAASARYERCAVFLDVRGLKAFDGAVRSAWVNAVLEHRERIDEVVVLSSDLLVTLSARAASVALAPLGVRFDVFTDERRYLARRLRRVAPLPTTPRPLAHAPRPAA